MRELVGLLAERDRFYGISRADPEPAVIEDALFGPVPAGRALVALYDGEVVGLAAYSFLWPAAGVTRLARRTPPPAFSCFRPGLRTYDASQATLTRLRASNRCQATTSSEVCPVANW